VPELADRIYERARLTGEFRLRSGATSNEYFDKYLFESDPRLIREIAEELVGLLPAGVQLLAGLELGGVPLAVAASQVSGFAERVRSQGGQDLRNLPAGRGRRGRRAPDRGHRGRGDFRRPGDRVPTANCSTAKPISRWCCA
jgi:orotate phosphoribosyltransferase